MLLLAAAAMYSTPPTAYTLTQTNTMSTPQTVTYYRDGNKVYSDVIVKPVDTKYAHLPHGTHVHTIYLLDEKTGWSWDDDPGTPCTIGFGTWGNPFEWMSQIFGTSDVASLHAKPAGAETIAGFPSTMYDVQMGSDKVRIWLDVKYGLLMKMASPAKGGGWDTDLEVQSFTIGKPNASVFTPPARCPKLK